MEESKTKPTSVTASEFIARVPDPDRRADAEALVQIFQRASGEPAVMWGAASDCEIGATNCELHTFTGIAGCLETNVPDASNACPATPCPVN